MIETFLVLWMLPLTYYGPRLWRLVASGDTVIKLTLLLAYSTMLVIFWLLAAYYAAVVLFYFLSRPLASPPAQPGDEWQDVAILYPTCNDFQVEAAMSCLSQDYPNFHLFLLDDSTKDKSRAAVEAFHAAHPEKTTIVRRPTRQGFKAGNLNHALRGAAAEYPFFAVVDADEKLPPDFMRRTVSHLWDSGLAFAQANHAPNPNQATTFARDIAPTILPFWHVHCRPRNRYGFVVFLGHGALVRRSAWEVAGGFPEVLTEDLAFSVALGARGLRGVFLEDLVCYEDFPTSYPTFKRQQERYLIGTTQVVLRYLGSLLRSREISLTEKIDFLMWCSPLYVPALALVFVALCSVGLASVFGHWETPVLSVLGREFVLPPVRMLDEPFTLLQSRGFQFFSVLCALSPAFAAITLGLEKRLRAVRLLSLATVPYLSLAVVAWRGILEYLLAGRIIWPPTGEHTTTRLGKDPDIFSADVKRAWLTKRAGVWRAPTGWEIAIGAVLAIASLASLNFAFFAVSSCLLIGALIQALGWEKRLVRVLCASCFIVILAQMVINVTLLIQSPGLVPLVFSVHF
jgi:cellulose synthase/poly-beta-1,6-N-acetylglucosamine synthase-like glycosyltransferase